MAPVARGEGAPFCISTLDCHLPGQAAFPTFFCWVLRRVDAGSGALLQRRWERRGVESCDLSTTHNHARPHAHGSDRRPRHHHLSPRAPIVSGISSLSSSFFSSGRFKGADRPAWSRPLRTVIRRPVRPLNAMMARRQQHSLHLHGAKQARSLEECSVLHIIIIPPWSQESGSFML